MAAGSHDKKEQMEQTLQGKIALVTAAGNGIGRASAEALAKRGATVIATDINAACVEIGAANFQNITGTGLDVLDGKTVQALVGSLPPCISL